jgi:hypothetical protein
MLFYWLVMVLIQKQNFLFGLSKVQYIFKFIFLIYILLFEINYLKDQWSSYWGAAGYMNISRAITNNCGISMGASFPLL